MIHSSVHTSTPISQFIPPTAFSPGNYKFVFYIWNSISVSAPGRFFLPARTQQSKVPGTFWDLLSLNFKAEVMVSILEMKQARFRGKLRDWCPRPHTRQSWDRRLSPAFLLDSHVSRVPSSELLRGCMAHAPAGAQTQEPIWSAQCHPARWRLLGPSCTQGNRERGQVHVQGHAVGPEMWTQGALTHHPLQPPLVNKWPISLGKVR